MFALRHLVAVGGRVTIAVSLVAGSMLLQPREVSAQQRARIGAALAERLASDAGSTLNVLVEAPQAEIDRLARTYGLRVQRRLGMGASLSGTVSQVSRLASDGRVTALSGDEVVTSTMAVSSQSTGANLLWGDSERDNRFGGLTGAGVGVAVLDSGIADHGDVSKRVRLRLDFTGGNDAGDAYGHGTHLAGIIAGSGGGSRTAEGSEYVGMAPGAELLSLKVLGADGTGSVSNVIAALEWVLANKDAQKIRVVNLSLGHASTSEYWDDPLGRTVERLVKAGLVVVASAGNLGKTEDGRPMIGMVVSPGYTPGALTVGALNTKGTVGRSDDVVATYSSRGPVGQPDDSSTWIIKPDVVAPGNAVVSAGAVGSYLWTNYPSRRVIGEGGGTYLVLSGSSMATAVTSGAVAQLLQLQPRLTPAEVKFALQFTAQRLNGFGIIEQGAGSINVPLAAGLVATRHVFSAPTKGVIGGEVIEAGQVAFSVKTGPGNRSGGLEGNTIVWGSRGGGLGGDTIVWGSRGGGLGGDTIVWGSRGGGLGGDTIVWGSRGGGLGGDTIVWGSRGGGLNGDLNSIAWGDSVVWGSRSAGLSIDALAWGGASDWSELSWESALAWGSSMVWGSKAADGGVVWNDTIVWGSRR